MELVLIVVAAAILGLALALLRMVHEVAVLRSDLQASA